MFRKEYSDRVRRATTRGGSCPCPGPSCFRWAAASTYVKPPPFFDGLAAKPAPPEDIRGARVLAVLGDSVTTDHISPAGDIAAGQPRRPPTCSSTASRRRTSTPTAAAAATTR